ncbi:MAG: DUF2079 domain-containing protein [Anaerolineae bacterium]|jgi:uncharacterized membrane protein
MIRIPRHLIPLALVTAAALAYIGFFSWLALERHQALMTHTADLGQIDLAVWNSLHGRFVQEVKGEQISTRLTDHVEPIFWPVSVVFGLWDDAGALLVLQAAVLGLTALVIWATVLAFGRRYPRGAVYVGATWAALAYLLAPQAQAATVADFHASPLAVLPLALLLYLGRRRHTGPALVAAITALAVKEEIALMVAVAGLYLAIAWRWRPGILIAGLAAAWFLVATFVIIPHYGAQAYGEASFPYLARYQSSGDADAAPAGLVAALMSRIVEPGRLLYLAGLLAAFAGAPLLAPEVAVIAAPLVAANVLSHYEAQYSGEFHYSAPFMSVLAIAAGVGATRALSWVHRRARPASVALVIVLAAIPFAYHLAEGFTPLGPEFELHRPAQDQPTAARLARLAALIPNDASLSLTPALHPHFSHRESIYTFPDLAGAQFVLLDIAGTTDMHPADLRRRFDELITAGYGVLDAADGLVLLQAGAGSPQLPAAFLDFARASSPPAHPLDVTFGTSLKLVGYDWLDDAKWGYTSLRLYWQALAPLPPNLAPHALLVDEMGRPVADTRTAPFVETFWHPVSEWVPGETLLTTTVAVPLGQAWGAYVGVVVDGKYDEPAARLAPDPNAPGCIPETNLVRLPLVQRAGMALRPWVVSATGSEAPEQLFGSWLRLEGFDASPPVSSPGAEIQVTTYWSRSGAPDHELALSLRLVGDQGEVVAQLDGPVQDGLYPPARWAEGEVVPDAKGLPLPDDLPPGLYTLVVLPYDRLTQAPLPCDQAASPVPLGTVRVTDGGSQ